MVRRNRNCNELCPTWAVQEFGIVADSVGLAPREGCMFPNVESDGSKGRLPWVAKDMSTALKTLMDAAGLAEGRNYSITPSGSAGRSARPLLVQRLTPLWIS